MSSYVNMNNMTSWGLPCLSKEKYHYLYRVYKVKETNYLLEDKKKSKFQSQK